jgi:hypothetical protein
VGTHRSIKSIKHQRVLSPVRVYTEPLVRLSQSTPLFSIPSNLIGTRTKQEFCVYKSYILILFSKCSRCRGRKGGRGTQCFRISSAYLAYPFNPPTTIGQADRLQITTTLSSSYSPPPPHLPTSFKSSARRIKITYKGILTNEKRGVLKVVEFDRSPFKLLTLRFFKQIGADPIL